MIRANTSSSTVFVSYAWGNSADQKKAWIHEKIVIPLQGVGYTVFWDHESILPGHSFSREIAAILREGETDILCICDDDFIKSADKSHSGVARELKIFAGETNRRDVRIIPLLIGSISESALPALLADRRCIDLTALIESGTPVGHTLQLVLDNATPTVIEKDIADRVRKTRIRDRAGMYFGAQSWAIHGNPVTRRVSIGDSRPLLPAQWMYADDRFKDHVSARQDRYHPGESVWYWEYGTAVKMLLNLGVAVSSEFFPDKAKENVEDVIAVGYAIARNIICGTRGTEPLSFDWPECVDILLWEERTTDALDRLTP
jgi:hypothetical protein